MSSSSQTHSSLTLAGPGFESPSGRENATENKTMHGVKRKAVPYFELDSMSDDEANDEHAALRSPPLLSPRRSPRHTDSVSSHSILSDSSPLRTPSPENVRSPFEDEWPVTYPPGPRIPFPPSPEIEYNGPTAAHNHGLGINLGRFGFTNGSRIVDARESDEGEEEENVAFDSFVFHPCFHTIEPRYTGARSDNDNTGLGITLDGESLLTESISKLDDETLVESKDDEHAYYHLPSGLLSPELVMSAEEFKASLRRWVVRRANRATESEGVATSEANNETREDEPETLQ